MRKREIGEGTLSSWRFRCALPKAIGNSLPLLPPCVSVLESSRRWKKTHGFPFSLVVRRSTRMRSLISSRGFLPSTRDELRRDLKDPSASRATRTGLGAGPNQILISCQGENSRFHNPSLPSTSLETNQPVPPRSAFKVESKNLPRSSIWIPLTLVRTITYLTLLQEEGRGKM